MKEFLVPNVRAQEDSLPFTPPGYTRVNPILLAKFEKPTEVAAAHIQYITSLPVLFNSNPNEIHKSHEKLIASVQALDTMNKFRNIKGYVRLIFDELPGIRADPIVSDKSGTFPSQLNHYVSELFKILKQYIILRNMRNKNVKMYVK